MLKHATATDLFPGLYETAPRLGKLDATFGHPGNMKTLVFLCSLARVGYAPLLEFGTFTGRTTYNVALNSPGPHYTIDIGGKLGARLDRASNLDGVEYPDYTAGEAFIDDPEVGASIELIIGHTKWIDLSSLRGRMGLVWVDAGHSYEQCSTDSTKAFDAVRPGGVIAWHDYGHKVDYWPGVKRAIDEIAEAREMYFLPDEEVVVYLA